MRMVSWQLEVCTVKFGVLYYFDFISVDLPTMKFHVIHAIKLVKPGYHVIKKKNLTITVVRYL